MMQHDPNVYLRHMLDYAREAVQLLDTKTSDELAESRVLQLALFHLVEIVGEAASRVNAETRTALPHIPWRGVIGMRNRIVHGYDVADLKVLWDTITMDLPPLITELEAALARKLT